MHLNMQLNIFPVDELYNMKNLNKGEHVVQQMSFTSLWMCQNECFKNFMGTYVLESL